MNSYDMKKSDQSGRTRTLIILTEHPLQRKLIYQQLWINYVIIAAMHVREAEFSEVPNPRLYAQVFDLSLRATRCLLAYQVEGSEHIPQHGGALVVSNHLKLRDPIFTGLATGLTSRRAAYIMAKKELFVPLLGIDKHLRGVGAFPVDRNDPGTESIREACAYIEDGALVFMYPQGTRSSKNDVVSIHEGAASILTRTEAPLSVMGIAYGGLLRAATSVAPTASYGELRDQATQGLHRPSKKDVRQALTALIASKIQQQQLRAHLRLAGNRNPVPVC